MKLRSRFALAFVGLTTCCLLALLFAAPTPATRDAIPSHDLSIASVNLWNVMFLWEVRRRGIARAMRGAGVDVIVMQEVRVGGKLSQIDDLQLLLPQHRWSAFVPATDISKDEAEGLAILSRLPIVMNFSTDITSLQPSPDTNRRRVVAIDVKLPSGSTARVVAVHLSYDRPAQCENVARLSQFLSKLPNPKLPTVLAGDWNAYPGDDEALTLLTGPPSAPSRCKPVFDQVLTKPAHTFADAWTAIEALPGLTFSNMPTPGPVSRPDRILVSSDNLRVVHNALHGATKDYANHYTFHVFVARLTRILAGGDCPFDCGPRGKCVCGVCVLGADTNCAPPCPTCAHTGETLAGSVFVVLLIALAGVRRWLRWRALVCVTACALCVFALALRQSVWVLWTVMPEEINTSDHLFLVTRLALA